jgi:ABC-type microcin C transport system duplicated ATPase subunit YejF
LRTKRASLLDDFEGLHTQRFNRRQAVAAKLSKALGPQIRVSARQAAEYSEYVAAIISALRGSNLRYNELAPLIETKMIPREFVEAVEAGDHESIAQHVSIGRDRATKIVAQLREAELENLLTVPVEDDAVFQLLDGTDYKNVQQLSVGQRCTVVLPIVLEHSDRVLIVDQPEDHLDNAFIVETLIRAIRARGTASQLFFTTHNANIPVLGDARQVIVMKSNGQRGFVSNVGPLDEPEIVHAITTIMEGGKEAFETRARFYATHG